jgi:hypothetical protein
MATLLSLADGPSPILTILRQQLGPREQPVRMMFLAKEAIDDIGSKIKDAPSDRGVETNPLEELADFFVEYIAGRELTFDHQFHPMEHIDSGIWELKTLDVRLFGWFPQQDWFVCTNVDLKKTVITQKLYSFYRDKSVAFRDALNLDEPKFIPGGDPDDVVSNYAYPKP